MADKHPYMSGSGGLVAAVNQLRKSFPAQVNSDTLKKLGIAPNNESFVLNILRFIGVLDAEGKKTANAGPVFSKHDDADFQKGFGEMVEGAYSDLFSLHGKDAWTLPIDKLISYFRNADHTSALVGARQAGTFQGLAALSGYAEVPPAKVAKAAAPRKTSKTSKTSAPTKVSEEGKQQPSVSTSNGQQSAGAGGNDVGLTVRIEINLPAGGDQETYDRIFKSIRENLLNAK